MREATAHGVRRTLRIPEDFQARPIASNYYWKNWIRDDRVERELRRFFLSLATKEPFLRDQPDIEAVWSEIDCLWHGQFALGLKAAYVSDGLALSMTSEEEWNNFLIECDIHEVVGEDVECRREVVHHASTTSHVEPQLSWIEERIRIAVRDGKELWHLRGDFFPALDWCSSVEDLMAQLPVAALPRIVGGLFSLNSFCATWQSGRFASQEIQCVVSPESEATLKKYCGERTFMCPDGTHRLFSWHAKVGSWRIYFDPASGPGRLLVGYVGKHLRTVKFS
ncbi:MAG: hypothetical protein V1792_05365 [Pseudomonadota bacterium]